LFSIKYNVLFYWVVLWRTVSPWCVEACVSNRKRIMLLMQKSTGHLVEV